MNENIHREQIAGNHGGGSGMKYSEFKAEVEGLGFNVKHFSQSVYVENQEKEIIAKVDLHSRYMLSTHTNSFFRLDETVAFKLYEICMMLSETPLAEREEEKKYQFKLSLPIGIESGIYGWLNQNTYTGEFKLSSRENTAEMKTIFMELEASQMDITGFEKVEVSE